MEHTMEFKEIILKSLQGLKEEQLREVAEFIYFVKQKTQNPERFREALEIDLIGSSLADLNSAESSHVEEEFENYQNLYPKE